jgi:hypothetical protein
VAVSAKEFLVRFLSLVFAMACLAAAEPRVDKVLVQMTPPGSTGLLGVRVEEISNTDFYRKLMAGQTFSALDQFAEDSGFDPRRDVRELLFATTRGGGVLMARGTFHTNTPPPPGAVRVRHGEYVIWRRGGNGFCILDATLAVAGNLPAVESALDEWKSGGHNEAQALLARVGAVNPQSQVWGISIGPANFLADNLPRNSSGLDFSHIFQGLEDTWFEADLSAGLRAEAHGTTKTEQEASNLRDAVRGMVGLGRLQVPENQSELLRAWDGITAEQQGLSIAVRVDIGKDLAARLIEMFNAGAPGGRGQKRAFR